MRATSVQRLVLLLSLSVAIVHGAENCTTFISACLADATCGPLATAYRTNCFGVLSTTCPTNCTSAWTALVANTAGFSTCTCDDDDVLCTTEGALYSKMCEMKTIRPLCNNVLGYCATRSNCVSLMPAYFRSCNGTGNPNKTCISECRSAVEPLAQNEVGALLGQCYCKADDMECKDFQTVTHDCGLITIVPTGTTKPGQTEGPSDSAALPRAAAFALVVVALVYLLI